jgi:O-antigen/teichoic acid export membrane protein
MLELHNITLTAFLIAFSIAIGVSIWMKDYVSALACFLTVASILSIKYYAWKKQKVTPENKQKVIVIKRK